MRMKALDQAGTKGCGIPYLGIAVLMSCIVLLLLAGIAAGGLSAAELQTPTTTTLWARTQDFAQFELSSVTAPSYFVSGADFLDTGEMNI